jgi:hypothetical protein
MTHGLAGVFVRKVEVKLVVDMSCHLGGGEMAEWQVDMLKSAQQ